MTDNDKTLPISSDEKIACAMMRAQYPEGQGPVERYVVRVWQEVEFQIPPEDDLLEAWQSLAKHPFNFHKDVLLAYFQLAQEVIWERITRRFAELQGTGPEGRFLIGVARTRRLEEGQEPEFVTGAYNAALTETLITLPGMLTRRVASLDLNDQRHATAYLNRPGKGSSIV